jgi:hypothetical protein
MNEEMLLNSAMEALITSAEKRIPNEDDRYQFYIDALKFFAKLGWEGQLDCSATDDLYDDAVCKVHPELAEAIEEDRSRRANDEEMAAEALEYEAEEYE